MSQDVDGLGIVVDLDGAIDDDVEEGRRIATLPKDDGSRVEVPRDGGQSDSSQPICRQRIEGRHPSQELGNVHPGRVWLPMSRLHIVAAVQPGRLRLQAGPG